MTDPDERTQTEGFRGFAWGTEKQAVIRGEQQRLLRDTGARCIYTGREAGMPCGIIYSFTGSKLGMGLYLFQQEHSNPNLYIEDARRIYRLIEGKYGSPVSDKWTWSKSQFRDNPEMHGLALELGHAVLEAQWDLPETVIYLTLRGDAGKVSLSVLYESKELAEEIHQERRARDAAGF